MKKTRPITDYSTLITDFGFAPLLIVLGVVLVSLAVGVAVVGIRNNNSSPVTNNQTTANQTITLDFLSSDKVNLDNIKTSPFLKSTQELPDGSVQYNLNSYLDNHDNQVVAKDNQIVFRRIVTFDGDSTPPKFSDYNDKLGSPDVKLRGSRYYGSFVETQIFPDKGYALIGNPNTDEVFEIQIFSPTTVSEYRTKWGSDIDQTEYINSENFQN